MKTDRELLELAAKALGINLVVEEIPHRTNGYGMETVFRTDGHPCRNWNPLTDDGDAMRLAVKLRITVSLSNQAHATEVWGFDEQGSVVCHDHDHNPYAATRRAIVRAAAELGSQS